MNLREEREKSRLTIYEVATALGLNHSTVSYHESGTRQPVPATELLYEQLYKKDTPWTAKRKKKEEPNRIREQRERSRLTRREVAKILGVRTSAVTEVETGRRRMSDEQMLKFARLFKCQTHELL
jgi:transcriptional regulator with XRE-family HTH domain